MKLPHNLPSNYTKEFLKAVEDVLVVEGFFSDDPNDKGGKTKYGISTPLALDYGIRDVSKINEIQAIFIYWDYFWQGKNLQRMAEINEPIAIELFEAGVNIGRNVPVRWLQTWLNVSAESYPKKIFQELDPDSVMGNKTIEAYQALCKVRGKDVVNKALYNWLNARQYFYYFDLATEKPKTHGTFFWGWVTKRCTFMPE